MGWLDLIDLAIDVKQSADLYKAREQLKRIEKGALQESLRKQVVEVLRNFVFASAQEVKTLEQHLKRSPQPVYVAARVLEWRFQDVGISPEVFPEFSDKEYVQRVQGDLANVVQDARSNLTADEISEAEECVNAFVQMPLLDKAIEAQLAHEDLRAVQAEWKQLSGERSKSTLASIAALGGSFIAFPSACILGSILGSVVRNSSLSGVLNCGILGAGGILSVGLLVGGVLLLAKSSNPRYRELQKRRRQCMEMIPDPETWEHIVSLFGQQNSEEYQHIRAEREKLIQDIMGQIDGYMLEDRFLPPSFEPGAA